MRLFENKKMKLGYRYRKRDTKNLPKNFCKAFSNFMENHKMKETNEWKKAIKILRKMEVRDKYNNIMMKKMMQNAYIVDFFK